MEIDGTQIGGDAVYFIAEVGVNHNGELDIASKLIDVAAEAGADAVKFQTYSPDTLATADAEKAEYAKETTDPAESQREMLRRYELSAKDHRILKDHCKAAGVTFLSTPFDRESASLLSELDVSAFKLGSGELTNKPLLEHVASFGQPTIVSTGMGTMPEVRQARDWITDFDPQLSLAFLHCTSEYPAAVDDVNLRAMESMMEQFPDPIGYSDHTKAPETPALAAVAGASIVEKHFTLDSTQPGPDHETSLEPDELEYAVNLVRKATKARGNATKKPTPGELDNRQSIRKSLHADTAIDEDARFTPENVAIKRPATGLPPATFETTIGERATKPLSVGDPITEFCVTGGVGEDD